jgi:hypothetical protein
MKLDQHVALIDSPKESIRSRKAKQPVDFSVLPKENSQNNIAISSKKNLKLNEFQAK